MFSIPPCNFQFRMPGEGMAIGENFMESAPMFQEQTKIVQHQKASIAIPTVDTRSIVMQTPNVPSIGIHIPWQIQLQTATQTPQAFSPNCRFRGYPRAVAQQNVSENFQKRCSKDVATFVDSLSKVAGENKLYGDEMSTAADHIASLTRGTAVQFRRPYEMVRQRSSSQIYCGPENKPAVYGPKPKPVCYGPENQPRENKPEIPKNSVTRNIGSPNFFDCESFQENGKDNFQKFGFLTNILSTKGVISTDCIGDATAMCIESAVTSGIRAGVMRAETGCCERLPAVFVQQGDSLTQEVSSTRKAQQPTISLTSIRHPPGRHVTRVTRGPSLVSVAAQISIDESDESRAEEVAKEKDTKTGEAGHRPFFGLDGDGEVTSHRKKDDEPESEGEDDDSESGNSVKTEKSTKEATEWVDVEEEEEDEWFVLEGAAQNDLY